MAEEVPFDEFKNPSPHYKFETTPGAQRMLSAPNTASVLCSNSSPMPSGPWQSHASIVSGTGLIQFRAAGAKGFIF